ncbi:lysophospholipid transporter LplT, partial [Parasutterella excrementihominis]
MTKGFYSIMLAQFLSSLADNALLIAAIALLTTLNEPAWMTPLLKLFFVVSYVIFAAWVGIFADSMPKGRVMFITNAVKTVGCIIMLFGTHPLLAYAIVGLGAAAYSPAKYGILTELLPPEKLVKANGWIEGLTVASIILGTGLGGLLISPMVDHFVQGHHVFGVHNAAQAAIAVMIFVYAAAAAVNLLIPDTGARYPKQDFRPIHTLVNFGKSCS